MPARSTHPLTHGASKTLHFPLGHASASSCSQAPRQIVVVRGSSQIHMKTSQSRFGHLDPTWCRRVRFPSGTRWVLMYAPQREHKNDFLLSFPLVRQSAKRKLTPARHSLLAARSYSTVQLKPSLLQPTKILASVEVHQLPDHPVFRTPDGVARIAFEQIPELVQTLLVSNQGGRRQSTEASISSKCCFLAVGVLKELLMPWPALQLTTLPKTQGRPSRKPRSRPTVA